MRKSTFKKIYVMAAAMLFAIGAYAQQEGVTMLPFNGATGSTEISLILDVTVSCPDSSLFEVDSVMMHSGVTIDGNAWQAVVNFDTTGANGQQPKLIPFTAGAQVGSLTIPNPTVYDEVTVVVWPDWTCPPGGLDGADSVMMHSGLTINGSSWQKVVPFDGTGANGQSAKMTKVEYGGRTGWILTYVPADFYGVEEGEVVTAINCVFNDGDWPNEGGNEAKDINHDGTCTDFRLQIGDGMPYKYSMTFVPNDFYPIEEGQKIGGINCVFNGGAWDGREGKAHKVDEEGCEDFLVPLGYDGIFTDKETHTFKLYPNPVGDMLYLSDLEDVNRVEIYDIRGKLVLSRNVENRQVTINTSELTKGIYVVGYQTSKGVLTSKFIKD